jgi:hypothetical protein
MRSETPTMKRKWMTTMMTTNGEDDDIEDGFGGRNNPV